MNSYDPFTIPEQVQQALIKKYGKFGPPHSFSIRNTTHTWRWYYLKDYSGLAVSLHQTKEPVLANTLEFVLSRSAEEVKKRLVGHHVDFGFYVQAGKGPDSPGYPFWKDSNTVSEFVSPLFPLMEEVRGMVRALVVNMGLAKS